MSLLIDPRTVMAVLLADGWHQVDQVNGRSSFGLDSYELGFTLHDGDIDLLHSGGRSGVCATGFQFLSGGNYVSGPLTAVLAVRHGKSLEERQPWDASQDNENEKEGPITERMIDKPRRCRSSGDI